MAAKRKKISKASKRRLMIFGTLSIVAIVSLFISLANYAVDLYNLKKEQEVLSNTIKQLQQDEENLKLQLEMLKDDEYLAKYAREHYLYSKDGEIVFKIDKQDDSSKTEAEELEFDSKYLIYTGIGLIVILVLYISLKKDNKKDN